MKIWYFDLRRNSHGSHRLKKIAATIWQKKNDLSFYVLYQLNHDIINKMSKLWKYFPDFVAFLVGNYETEQSHHDIDSKHLKWGLHIDINSIFCGIFPDFLRIPKFPHTYQHLLTFSSLSKILTFSWLFSWPCLRLLFVRKVICCLYKWIWLCVMITIQDLQHRAIMTIHMYVRMGCKNGKLWSMSHVGECHQSMGER